MIKYPGKKGEIQMTKTQRSYTAEYRANAVKLAQEIGASAAARELKIPSDTLYTWISRAKNGDLPMSTTPPDPKNARNLAERVRELEQQVKMLRSENVQIMRENQILEDAAAFFAARRKKSGNV
jgi:transposase